MYDELALDPINLADEEEEDWEDEEEETKEGAPVEKEEEVQ